MQDENTYSNPILYRDPEGQSEVQTYAIPDRALNVEAATLALLEDSDSQGLNKFGMYQALPRDQKVEWIDDARSNAQRRYDEFVRSGLSGVLSDTSIPAQARMDILDKAPTTKYAPDDSAAILNQAGALSPSEGETGRGSEVRSVFAEQALKAWKYVDDKQDAVNAAVNRRDGVLGQVTDTMSMLLVPLQDSIAAAKISREAGGSRAKAVTLPGSYIQDLNKKFLEMSLDERVEFTRTIADIVSKSSGIMSSSNQLRADAIIQQITDEQGMSNTEAWFSNILNLADLVGVGIGAKSTLKAGSTAARNFASRTRAARDALNESRDWFTRAGRDVPMESGVPSDVNVTGDSRVSPPQTSKNQPTIEALEQELIQNKETAKGIIPRDAYEEARSSLELLKGNKERMGSSASPAEVGSFIRRQEERKARIAELQATVDGHEAAVRASDNIADIETRIDGLRKNDELVQTEKNPIASAIDRAYSQSFIATSHPRAPGNILSASNFDKGRTLYAQTVMDESGQLAEALYGTNRTEAVVSQVSPQFTDATGRVTRKMDNPEVTLRKLYTEGMGTVANSLRDGLRYTPAEMAAARASVVNDYTDATGMVLNDAMSSFRFDGDKVKVSGVYTNGQGGWTSSEDAIAQAKFATRNRPITDDSFTVMRLEGDEFVPVDRAAVAGKEGVYAIKMDLEDLITDRDVKRTVDGKNEPAWDALDVKRNWLDRFSGSGRNAQGSVNRHVFEPNSSLHKTLTGSMTVAEDKSSVVNEFLLNRFKNFSDQYVKLDKAMKGRVDEYIRQANVQELPFDATALRNQFPAHVVDMLRDWRDAWDGMYILENSDVMKSLNHEGYQFFQNANLEAVVRKAHSGFVDAKVYDPATDTVRKLSTVERQQLTQGGGYIGQFRSSMNLNGEDVDFMMIRNTPTEYARAFNGNDRILEYREGYYQVSYKTPKFVEETYVDTTGKTVSRAVQVAGSTKDAQAIADRMTVSNPTRKYTVRGDERKIDRNRDVYWELNNSFGRIAQRHRGKLLENTVGIQYSGADDFILNPADSAVRASLSLGGRMAMRDAITTAKTRFLDQFGHLLSRQDNGAILFPASRDQIYKKGEYTTKELADARTTWEYINYMENGYINAMDESIKMGFNYLADLAGLKGYDTVEKLANGASDINITGKIKGGVFLSYLATNPLRQIFVQGGQSLRLAGYSHVHLPKVLAIQTEAIMNPNSAFAKFLDETGMIQSIQRNNLIRGTLLEASNRQTVTGRMAEKGVSAVRKVGFDLGESVNTQIAAAAVWEKYTREGRNVSDSTVRAEMHAEIRALNRNMNRAGDMPYNHNFLALLFTYMQVPHKFALQWADRALTPTERTRLIAADLTMWGLPAGIGTWVAQQEFMEDFPDLKDIVEEGAMGFTINQTLSQAYGQKVGIDLSSMAPYDLTGFGDIMVGMAGDKGWSNMLAETPAGRVLGLGENSRLGFAIQTTSRFFSDLKGNELEKVQIGDVADSWLRLSSGWTNAQEAIIMHQLGKVVDKQGRTVDDSVNMPEVVAKVLGFGTKDTKQYYESVIKANDSVKKVQERAKEDVKQTMLMIRHMTKGDVQGAQSIALFTQALSDRSNFPNDMLYRQYLAKVKSELALTANSKMMKTFTSKIVPETVDDLAMAVRGSPLNAEEKEAVNSTLKKLRDGFAEMEAANKGN